MSVEDVSEDFRSRLYPLENNQNTLVLAVGDSLFSRNQGLFNDITLSAERTSDESKSFIDADGGESLESIMRNLTLHNSSADPGSSSAHGNYREEEYISRLSTSNNHDKTHGRSSSNDLTFASRDLNIPQPVRGVLDTSFYASIFQNDVSPDNLYASPDIADSGTTGRGNSTNSNYLDQIFFNAGDGLLDDRSDRRFSGSSSRVLDLFSNERSSDSRNLDVLGSQTGSYRNDYYDGVGAFSDNRDFILQNSQDSVIRNGNRAPPRPSSTPLNASHRYGVLGDEPRTLSADVQSYIPAHISLLQQEVARMSNNGSMNDHDELSLNINPKNQMSHHLNGNAPFNNYSSTSSSSSQGIGYGAHNNQDGHNYNQLFKQQAGRANTQTHRIPGGGIHSSYSSENLSGHPIYHSNANINSLNSFRRTASPAIPGMTSSPSTTKPNLDTASVEDLVVKTCKDILKEAACHALKAVELANTLRARVGTDVLAFVRENWGGLLSLLEKYDDRFRVDRIPKNDMVTLLGQNPQFDDGSLFDDGSGVFASDTSSSIQSKTIGSSPVPSARSLSSDSQPPPSFDFHGHLDLNQNISKCLHVGNVPATLTEKDLVREFEKFGSLETVKLVNQRGRRFAFVCYRTPEMAAFAKQALSRLHPWKSAISFAHRESASGQFDSDYSQHNFQNLSNNLYQQQLLSVNHHNGSGLRNPHNMLHQQQQQQQYRGNRAVGPSGQLQFASNANNHQAQLSNGNANMRRRHSYDDMPLHIGDPVSPNQEAFDFSPDQGRSVSDDYQVPTFTERSTPSGSLHQTINSLRGWFGGGSVASDQQPPSGRNQSSVGYPPVGQQGNSAASVAISDPVLRRLCDDTYVPTQAWPVDPIADAPYYQAVVLQLMQFGGTTSISKLRGFLRNRISAPDNIKSVPLKAMLGAYPQFFALRNNQVTLLVFPSAGLDQMS